MLRRSLTRTGLALLAGLASLVLIGAADADQGMHFYRGQDYGGHGYETRLGGNFGSSGPAYYGQPAYYSQPAYYGQPVYAPAGQLPANGSFYPMTVSSNRTVTVNVSVPADAALWFDDARTTQTGTQRQFVSPPLQPGHDYAYAVKARWREGGQEVTRTRRVTVHAGDVINLSFEAASTPTAGGR